MNSHPFLLNEDRPEYERLIDRALRIVLDRPEPAAGGRRLGLEQLRAMALGAAPDITAAAADEYQHYVAVRDEVRESASRDESSDAAWSAAVPQSTDRGARSDLGRRFGVAVLGAGHPGADRNADVVAPSRWATMSYGRRLLAALLGLRVRPEVPSAQAAGAAAAGAGSRSAGTSARSKPKPRHGPRAMSEPLVLGALDLPEASPFSAFPVLAPLLAGAAAVFFLLIGFILEVFASASEFSRSLFTAGWVFGALTVVLLVIWRATLAYRRRHPPVRGALQVLAVKSDKPSYARETTRRSGLGEEHVNWAAQAWSQALLERGILPFLRDALTDPGTRASYWDASTPPVRRVPRLGYGRPNFSGPGDDPSDGPAPRPRYSSPDFASPDFTSPDFGSPDHHPE
ncbi:hypothetical protein [Streptomyces sp. NBC_01012]|uniref:hypothetical protein n=1 Tax=Streptomyces sp. NBC_01012 TaxID=2903717 RepID=UPI003870C091|nr:hypothetical protein OG623_11980 [Streptomyces sp. NBC_01012]